MCPPILPSRMIIAFHSLRLFALYFTYIAICYSLRIIPLMPCPIEYGDLFFFTQFHAIGILQSFSAKSIGYSPRVRLQKLRISHCCRNTCRNQHDFSHKQPNICHYLLFLRFNKRTKKLLTYFSVCLEFR